MVELVASILPIVALFQVFDGLGGVTAGILRAIGKQVSTTGSSPPPLRPLTDIAFQFTGALLNLRYA